MYAASFADDKAVTSQDDGVRSSSKVDVVCDAIKSALYSLDKNKYVVLKLTICYSVAVENVKNEIAIDV